MGSNRYAQMIKDKNENIVAMLSIESIGYYSDQKNSQKYPFPFSFFYPDTANFIGFVGNLTSASLVREAIGSFRHHAQFPSEGISAPSWTRGVHWSDQWSFWRQDYPAIMITGTALYRNPYYHTAGDTPAVIDYSSTARVVHGLSLVIKDLAGRGR